MSDQKPPTNRRGDKFNLTDNGRRLLSEFLEIPATTASQNPSSMKLEEGTKADSGFTGKAVERENISHSKVGQNDLV